MKTDSQRYLFAGGGTGGHVTPNLAIAQELLEEDPTARVLYVGTHRGAERRIVGDRDLPFRAIAARPFASPRRLLAFVRFFGALVLGFFQSLWLISRFRPHVVVASGGYASVAPVLAAAVLRRPVFLHEQNVRPGKANVFLSRFATRIGVSFEEAVAWFPKEKVTLSGYPVRKRIAAGDREAARGRLQIPRHHRVAFILGGSMGARSINRATVDGLARLLAQEDVTVIHSTGLTDNQAYNAWQDTIERLKGNELPDSWRSRYILRRYFDQIEDAYAASDIVVARAGAGVVMELATLGKPALLIPKGDAADPHQLMNALSMRDRGSADVLLEELYDEGSRTITRVHGDQLARKVTELLGDRDRLEQMSRSARGLAIPDATRANAKMVRDLASRTPAATGRSVQHLVGRLVDPQRVETEIIFALSTIGPQSTADIRTPLRGAGERAWIRRAGRSREDTSYILIPRRGRILLDGRTVEGPTPLAAGQELTLGPNRLMFHLGIKVVEVEPGRGSMLGKVLVTGVGTAASRVLGMLREVVLAVTFGTGAVVDVFVAALTASNLLRRVFAENAVDSAFLPTFTMLWRGGRREEARRLFRAVATWLVILTVAVTVIGMATVDVWLPWLVPGFAAKGLLADAVGLTRIMLPYLVLVAFAAFLGATLRAFNRFATAAYSSLMFSVGVIVGTLLYPWLGLASLGYGVLLGGLGQAVVCLPPLVSSRFRRETGLGFRPLLDRTGAGMKKIRATAPKIVADVTVSKFSSVVDIMIASTLAVGHPSVLYFAMLLFQFPFALVSQSINTVVLKEFSDSQAARDQDACRRLVTSGITWNVFLLLPISAYLILLSPAIVGVLFQYGSFGADDTNMVAIALACYSLGLVGWGLHGLAGRFFAARLEMEQALVTNMIAVVVNVALSLAFVGLGLSFAGLALGTSFAFLGNGLYRIVRLNRNLHAEGGGFDYAEILPSLGKTAVATGAAVLVAGLVVLVAGTHVASPSFLVRLMALGAPTLAGTLAFVGVALALRSPEMDEIVARVLRQVPQMPRGAPNPAHMNVYCLRPSQLLRAAETHPETVRAANLTRRVHELLSKPSWKLKNIGVKLVGRLRLVSLKYVLVQLVEDRTPAPRVQRLFGGDFRNPGFVRRNAVSALAQLDSCDEDVDRVLVLALSDPYFEVRSSAARAIAKVAHELSPAARRAAITRLTEMVNERNFEVAVAAVKGLQAVALDDSVADVLRSLHYHANWQVRNAVVQAWYDLYKRGVIENRDFILEQLDDLLVTCDSFQPVFDLKDNIRRVRVQLAPLGQVTQEEEASA